MNIKKQNGVTLTILVITIVVMLILVGGTVGMIFDGEGLLKKSVESKKIQEEYANREEGKTNELINDLTSVMNGEPIQKEYTFDCTGAVQERTVPVTGVWKLEVWGAQGGTKLNFIGGKGGYSKGIINLDKGDKLYIQVGEQGKTTTSSSNTFIQGGYNGGGQSYGSATGFRGSGGGATDIRIGEDSLYSRVIVAGGGGGAWNTSLYKDNVTLSVGGGTTGGNSTGHGANVTSGGTRISGGKNSGSISGSFGNGGGTSTATTHAGGGGGWYGGAANSGGSGWVYTEEAYTNWAANSVEGQSKQWKLDKKYYLTEAQTIDGASEMPTHDGTGTMTGNSGNGYAKITWVGK